MITEKEFVEIVEAMAKRPKMYTQNGSFEEATSFLEGYGVGANVGNMQYHSVFTPFFNWLKSTRLMKKKERFGWNEFREMFPSDIEAMENLSRLYKEYADSS